VKDSVTLAVDTTLGTSKHIKVRFAAVTLDVTELLERVKAQPDGANLNVHCLLLPCSEQLFRIPNVLHRGLLLFYPARYDLFSQGISIAGPEQSTLSCWHR